MKRLHVRHIFFISWKLILKSISKALDKCLNKSTSARVSPFHYSQPDSTQARRHLTVKEKEGQTNPQFHRRVWYSCYKGSEVVNSSPPYGVLYNLYTIKLVMKAYISLHLVDDENLHDSKQCGTLDSRCEPARGQKVLLCKLFSNLFT